MVKLQHVTGGTMDVADGAQARNLIANAGFALCEGETLPELEQETAADQNAGQEEEEAPFDITAFVATRASL